MTVRLATVSDPDLREAGLTSDAFLTLEHQRLAGADVPRADVQRCKDCIAAARERGLTWTDEERGTRAQALVIAHQRGLLTK
jgi:hypothetical protein